MAEETRRLPANMLTAEGLLENKGLKYCAWDEYEKSANTLPRSGMKQFEPNNSWLQNVQIEKGIMTRKDLIGIERVDRISQLASAEWLPALKRAKVKKYSGQDWGCFGLEKNGALYLIPEEALFLLEANCLELIWNDVPLSIQQAYELLIDNVECSLEEYRVYNQLVRHGYRIQRFTYSTDKSSKNDESTNTKRKVIVEPENGLWRSDIQQENKTCAATPNRTDADTNNSPPIEICGDVAKDKDISNNVQEVVDDLICSVENNEAQFKRDDLDNITKSGEKSDTDLQIVNIDEKKRKRSSKVEIISEETLLGSIRIVTDRTNDDNKGINTSANWRAARIQRNVKLVPKRTDKLPLIADISDSNNTRHSESFAEKHKLSSMAKESPQLKKFKHEVIELSDDEIQEVPKPMTRMELLNLIPDIAFQSNVTIKISRGYIPQGIKPHKTTYHYESIKLKSLSQRDKKLRSNQNQKHTNGGGNQDAHRENNTSTSNDNNNNGRRNTNIVPFNQGITRNVHSVLMQDYFSMHHRQYTNYPPNYAYNRLPCTFNQNVYWHHRNTLFENVFVSTAVHQNRFTSVQMHNLSVPNIGNNVIRNFFTRNQFYHNFHQNTLPSRRIFHQRIVENTSIECGNISRNALLPEPRQRYWPRNHPRYANTSSNREDEDYRSSFKMLPGASSWSELKTKWREEKTITIDDEDTRKEVIEDCNEVQVVGQTRSPLVGPKNASSLEEVFSKLRIIKSAPEKIVRRKKSKYKISYNVYSNTQNFRKASPGLPYYRVVVIRQDEPFIQPIELHRLMQDTDNSPILLACVSMSITYIQPGFISIPNLT